MSFSLNTVGTPDRKLRQGSREVIETNPDAWFPDMVDYDAMWRKGAYEVKGVWNGCPPVLCGLRPALTRIRYCPRQCGQVPGIRAAAPQSLRADWALAQGPHSDSRIRSVQEGTGLVR